MFSKAASNKNPKSSSIKKNNSFDLYLTYDNKNQKKHDIALWSIELLDKVSSKRQPLENIWREIEHFVLPLRKGNSSKNQDIYDSTAIISADYLVGGIWSLISNSSLNWFNIKQKTNKYDSPEIQKWFNELNLLMKEMLNNTERGFYHKSYEFYTDLVCYGTAIFFISENLQNKNINYQSMSLSNTYLYKIYKDNDTVIRRVSLTAVEAYDAFGKEALSGEILEALENDIHEVFDFIHICLPSNYFSNNRTKLSGMKYSSYYIDVLQEKVVFSSGHYEFPYMIARWSTNSNEVYGQSPAMSVLADIKMINAMSKTILISAQKQVDPPILAPSETVIQGIKSTPGGIIYGGIDPVTGNQLLQPLLVNGDLSHAYELQEQRRNVIREAFYNSLLLYTYANNATATEIVSTNEQKLRILGSKVSRIQSEFLYPVLIRQLGLMKRLNLLPKLPKGIDFNKIDFDIEFTNSWNRYQKIQESNGLLQLNNLVDKIRPFKPEIVDCIDWQEILKLVSQANGVPSNIFNNHHNV